MKLDVGSMDNVQTGFDTLPALKNVVFEIEAPDDKSKETVEFLEGKIKAINFRLKVVEPTPYVTEVNGQNVQKDAQGRVLFMKCNFYVDRDTYLSWKGCTPQGYDSKDFLRGLKSLGNAIGVDFGTQDVEDAYGRKFRANIIQRFDKEDESKVYNDVNSPKKLA